MYQCVHAYIHTYIHVCIHLFIYTFIHLYIYSFIHLFIYTFIHVFTDTLNTYLLTVYVNEKNTLWPTDRDRSQTNQTSARYLYHQATAEPLPQYFAGHLNSI